MRGALKASGLCLYLLLQYVRRPTFVRFLEGQKIIIELDKGRTVLKTFACYWISNLVGVN